VELTLNCICNIRVDKPSNFAPFAYDVLVDVDESGDLGKLNVVDMNYGDKEIMASDHKISELMHIINKSKIKREFLQAFSENPVEFINQWVSSQTRDIETVLGDVSVSYEATRKSEFYRDQDWLMEAVSKYLSHNAHQKLSEHAQNLSSRH
jgi:SWI/SNF-related matrix-associated actin-dependent regulator of chromatin subfamily D